MMQRSTLNEVGHLYDRHPAWMTETLHDLFGTNNFNGKRVLDVGAGTGLLTCAIAALGAKEIVALEPELEGATNDAHHTLMRNIETLSLATVSARLRTWQQFDAEPQSFDIILMYAVINHLDETHVQKLHVSPESYSHYVELLRPAYNYLKPGGMLVVLDITRTHFFSPLIDRGVLQEHPYWKGIEWEKHQDVDVWMDILKEVGFSTLTYHWSGFTRYKLIRLLARSFQPLTKAIRPFFIIRAFK